MSKKVIDTLNRAEKEAMQDLSLSINDELARGNASAEKAVRHYISAGLLMNKAKLELGSDIRFGAWRKENLTCSTDSSRRYMQVASKYGELGVNFPMPSMSILSEMARSSKEVEAAIRGKLERGEKVSQRDAKNMRKANTSSATGGQGGVGTTYKREPVIGETIEATIVPEQEQAPSTMTRIQQEQWLDDHKAKEQVMAPEGREARLFYGDERTRILEAESDSAVFGISNFSNVSPARSAIEDIYEAMKRRWHPDKHADDKQIKEITKKIAKAYRNFQ